LDTLFPKDKDTSPDAVVDPSAIKKLVFDELVYDPFCIVFFFTVISLLEGKGFNDIYQKLVKEYWTTQKASWAIWPIAQFLNFQYIPPNLRILFINLIGFFWSIFLQVRQSKK